MAASSRIRYQARARARFVEEHELSRCGEIGSRAFNEYAMGWYSPGKTIALDGPDGRLVACLVLTPMPGWWGAAKVPMCAVGAVATDPGEQKKGYAGALMVETVRLLRDRKYAVCPLWPFSFRYYGKFGWALGSLDLQLKARAAQLRPMGTPTRVRPAKPSDLPAVEAVYSRFSRRYNGCSVRPSSWWLNQKRNFPGGYLVHRNGEGAIDGYLRYLLRPRPFEEGKTASVRELAVPAGSAEGDLAAALANLPEVSLADFVLPADTCLPILAEERIEMNAVQRLEMRVLDPLLALSSLRPPRGLKGSLAFAVHDWVVDSRRPVPASVDIENGRVMERKRRPRGGIRCSIQTFSQLFSGLLSASRAERLGRLEAARPADLRLCDRLLSTRIPFRSPDEAG